MSQNKPRHAACFVVTREDYFFLAATFFAAGFLAATFLTTFFATFFATGFLAATFFTAFFFAGMEVVVMCEVMNDVDQDFVVNVLSLSCKHTLDTMREWHIECG